MRLLPFLGASVLGLATVAPDPVEVQLIGGTSTALVEVRQNNGDTVFLEMVDPGGEFSFTGTAGPHDTLGPKIRIFVDGRFNAEIHTGCSQPIGTGQVEGDFTIVAGSSRNGGPLCPLNGPPTPDCGDCSGQVDSLTLRYAGEPPPPNMRPFCSIAPIADVVCQGSETSVVLDGSRSFDPDKTALTYQWESCSGSWFDDPTSPTPVFTVDTSVSCELTCTVMLHVSDDESTVSCEMNVVIIPTIEPHFDLDPIACPNEFDINSFADLARYRVSLVGNDFDVTQVDVPTLSMSRVNGVDMMAGSIGTIFPVTGETVQEDVTSPFVQGVEPCDCAIEPTDTIPDLAMNFIRQEMVDEFLLEAVQSGEAIQLALSGNLLSGEPFVGRDCMIIINNNVGGSEGTPEEEDER